jgi:hypothetical protein
VVLSPAAVEQGFDEETVDCFLQFGRDDFDTYDEYVKATGSTRTMPPKPGSRYINEAIDACPVSR